MKRVLYISNMEVPYRAAFFNELAKHCRLTVLYEIRGTRQRNAQWAKSESKQYEARYVTRDIFSVFRRPWDGVILGCYNTPLQILASFYLRLRKIPYVLNLDGEPFLEGNSWKSRCKRFLLRGAGSYLTAGEKAAGSLKMVAGDRKITAYPFSSLKEAELGQHRPPETRTDTILVVGQYVPYKGMDIALEAARLDKTLRYKFVGMGQRTKLFLRSHQIPENVELIPFLQKQDLEREYSRCGLLVLPSRRECWGLVINEGASFGTPIVSTWGSGAAVEFLSEAYPQFLAQPGDPEDLLRCIRSCLAAENREAYSGFLREKAGQYSIERSVQAHLAALEVKMP